MVRFHFRCIPFLATVVVVIIGVLLGFWQMRRAEEKQRLQTQWTSSYRALRGRFLSTWPIYLENRPMQNVAGFYVVMPFEITTGVHTVNTPHIREILFVIRGWLPRDPKERLRLAPYTTPAGELQIEGKTREDFGRILQLGQPAHLQPGIVVQNMTRAALAGRLQEDTLDARTVTFLPFVMEQTTNLNDGLIRAWPQPSAGIEKHWGYAMQWFSLAAMACLFFIISGYQRDPHEKPDN